MRMVTATVAKPRDPRRPALLGRSLTPIARVAEGVQQHPRALLAVFVGLALLLRLPGIASRDLWVDEIAQFAISSAPSNREVLDRLVMWDRNPPGFALLVHGALRLGSSEALVRLPSLVGGIGAVVVAWYLGRQWLGKWGGTILALLCAVCPSYVYFSREARPYAVGLFAIYGFLLSLSAFRHRPNLGRALLLGFACVTAIALQYANAVVVAVGLGALVSDVLRETPRRWSLLASCGGVAGAAGVMATVTVLAFMRHQIKIQGTGSTDFLKNDFFRFDSLSSIVFFLRHNTLRFLKYTTFAEFMPSPWGTICLFGWLPVLPAVVGALGQRGPRRLLGVVSLGTLAAFIFMAGVGAHPFGAIRHMLPLTPSVFLLFTYGIVLLLQRGGLFVPLAWGCLSLLVVQMVAADYRIVPTYAKYEVRKMISEIGTKATSEDSLVAVGDWTCVSLWHYLGSNRRFANVVYVHGPLAPKFADSLELRRAVETSFERSSNIWVLGVGPPQKIDLSATGAVCIEERVTHDVHAFRWHMPEKGTAEFP